MKREELLKHAGKMVIVHYLAGECFVIGWFFAMDQLSVQLKITSTRFESYESKSVGIDEIDSIQEYEMN